LALTASSIPFNLSAEQSEAELLKQARITKHQAKKIALARVKGGTIKSAELEKEKGVLIWSFDIAQPGKKDATEVRQQARSPLLRWRQPLFRRKKPRKKRSKNGSHVKTSTEAVAENTLYSACSDLRFQLHKRSPLFIGMHNEPLSIVAMCVNNPDRSPFTIHG
jgi:peptidase YpeB-like protein